MRIVYLHQYYNTDQMAGSTRSAEMARRLAAAGHDVHVVTSLREPTAGPRDWRETTVDGYRVHWCPVPYSNRMGFGDRLRAFGAFALRASGRAAALRGDVVFATSTPLTIAIPGAWAAWRSRAPMVLEVRDLWPELPIAIGALKGRLSIALARGLERWAYRRSTRVVALSPGMRDGVIAAGVPPECVAMIPNSCDLELFDVPRQTVQTLRAGTPWLGARPMVLYAGTLGRMNGVGYLAAMARAAQGRRPDAVFVALGDGAEAAMIRAQAERDGTWQRNFFLVPPVPKREVAAWFAAADIVCSLFIDLPEMRANSANKYFDGLAAGRAVAVNYGGWHAELLTRHQAGIVMPAGDPKAAADLALAALADPGHLTAMGAAARRLAGQEFDRDRLAGQLIQVLEAAAR